MEETDVSEERISPLLVRRFLRAFVRAAQKKKSPHPAGAHLKQIPHHIYTFQKDVLNQQPGPRLLREELNELQRKVNLALNQEKYITTIQEQENKILSTMDMPFHAMRHVVQEKLVALKYDTDFPVPAVPLMLPLPVPAHLPAVQEPSFHQRIIAQVEQQLAAVEQYAAQASKEKSVDTAQLARIKKLIGTYQKKIRQLKKKHAAA